MSDKSVAGKIEFAPFGTLTPEARPGDWKIVAEAQNKRIANLETDFFAVRNALIHLLAAIDADSRIKKRDYYYERKAALAALKMK